MQADFGGGHGDTQRLGYLVVSPAVDVLENHHRPLRRGEIVQGAGQLRPEFGVLDGVCRVGSVPERPPAQATRRVATPRGEPSASSESRPH